ncbi:MAG: TIM44-like domain-containing protein [Oscillospiraceae bacterium]
MKKRFAIFMALVLITFSLFSVVGFADFGDFAGDSDWGGGWDSDWDSGWDSDWDSDYDYDYSGSSGTGNITVVVVIVVFALTFLVMFGTKAKTNGKPISYTVQHRAEPLVNNLADLKERDPGFNESQFLEDASNLYVRMQNAWTARDLTPIRTRLTAELYAKSERQVQTYIDKHQTNHVDRISVLNSSIVGCTSDDKNDIVTVELTARVVDYVTDDNTGNIVRGSDSRELFMTYRWTFIRTLGKVTGAAGEADGKHCPNCGAPIDLNQSAVCSFCGSVVESGDYDWVLSNIQGISQRSN